VPALPPRTRLAAWVGGRVGALSRRVGRGSGTVVGGRAILALDPDALRHLARGRKVALVSGTNGKTTTTSLLAAAAGTLGPVVTNLLGANLPAGVAAALVDSGGDTAVLEVDEAWLARVAEATRPALTVLLNLSRDQLDRNNEVRHLAARWRELCASGAAGVVVANADDPLVAWAASAADQVIWVGAGQGWTADAAGCPACGGRILFAEGFGAGWACTSCSLQRPKRDVWIEDGHLCDAGGQRRPLELALPGRCNLANAAMALTAATWLGADGDRAAAALAATTEVAGRYRQVQVGSTTARLLLSKNPAGWTEVFDMLGAPPRPVVVAINARIADGRDPSWLWDVPFERLAGRLVVATGERSRDLAVRLRYAGVDYRREPDLVAALRRADAPEVDVVANYTAFHQLAARLGQVLAPAGAPAPVTTAAPGAA
jgi:UDP-N-acetylmuramyl tripeptide synthase